MKTYITAAAIFFASVMSALLLSNSPASAADYNQAMSINRGYYESMQRNAPLESNDWGANVVIDGKMYTFVGFGLGLFDDLRIKVLKHQGKFAYTEVCGGFFAKQTCGDDGFDEFDRPYQYTSFEQWQHYTSKEWEQSYFDALNEECLKTSGQDIETLAANLHKKYLELKASKNQDGADRVGNLVMRLHRLLELNHMGKI